MVSVIGIDSRIFIRNVIKKDGTRGHFESVVGIAVKVKDYLTFDKKYKEVINKIFLKIGEESNYQYYCINDLKTHPQMDEILNNFAKEISGNIEKIHVIYTLFSPKRRPYAQVYGRYAKRKKLKLAIPERTYFKLISQHLTHCFPIVCAWKLTDYLSPKTVEFHLDSYSGHICEAQERIDKLGYKRLIFPSGDCSNPVISTADLLLGLLDKRLEIQKKFLIFDNIRPALPEFGDNLLVYPILNKHLPFITPLDKKPINTISEIKHPVFWIFKGNELIDSKTTKRSETYRNLVDYASNQCSVVKMFDKREVEYFQDGDYGVYLNEMGKEIIESYQKIGKKFKLFNLNSMVSK